LARYRARRRPATLPIVPPRTQCRRAHRGPRRTARAAVVDLAAAEVYATLLDEGRYLCSERTMYRLLAAHQEVRERRNQLRHPHYTAPRAPRPSAERAVELGYHQAPRASEVDLLLPVRLDVFSRYVVGWMVAHRESATLAERFIRGTRAWQRIGHDQLTIHADRGPAMTSKPAALLLADLGVTRTHARPHVSNDNPFSEAQFKTLKYRPAFPERFGSIQDARAYCHAFSPWYNAAHRHGGLGLLTPADVHYGLAEQRVAPRASVLARAYAAHPERFPRGLPRPPARPLEVWINRPSARERPRRLPRTTAREPAVSFHAGLASRIGES
jgi:putative transposase